jgi:hypothetical protein
MAAKEHEVPQSYGRGCGDIGRGRRNSVGSWGNDRGKRGLADTSLSGGLAKDLRSGGLGSGEAGAG